MRIALLFPPAVLPTGPPLGIASLKGWLQSCVGARVEVRNFDLNFAHFEQACRWQSEGRLRMSLRKMDQQTTAQKVKAAVRFFRGEEAGAFFDQELYDEHARIYTGFGSVLNGLFDSFARKLLLGLPVPTLATMFLEELLAPVRAFEPDLAGFSILFSQQLFFAIALAKFLKDRGGPKIALGGATFSVMPDPGRLLGPIAVSGNDGQGSVDAGRLVDYLVVGEGEEGVKALVESGLCPHEDVPGLVYRKEGKLIGNPARGVLDLDALPVPDFSDTVPGLYHSPAPVLPYLSSRGCPWRRCAFCTHQKTYLHYREEHAEVAAGKISRLQEKYGASHFCLVDEMLAPRRLDAIARELIGKNVRVRFSAYARPSGFLPPVFETAHRAGLRLVLWGVESASQRVLDLMGKGTKAREIESILHAARKAGIWNMLFVLLGFPTETKAEWLSTLDFLDSCRESIHALSRSRFLLLEGSSVFLNPGRYGIKRILDRPQRDPVSVAYDYEVTEGLSVEESSELFRESLARLSGAGRSPWFGQFREHMLLYAAREASGSLSSNPPAAG